MWRRPRGFTQLTKLMPVMEAMKHINDWLGEEVIRFNPLCTAGHPAHILTRFAWSAARRGIKKFMPRLSSSCISQIISRRFLLICHHRRSDSYAIPPRLTACSRRLSAILTALSATHQIKSPHVFSTLSVRKYSHFCCVAATSFRDCYLPPETRGLFPRHLRAEKSRVFLCMHGSLYGFQPPCGPEG